MKNHSVAAGFDYTLNTTTVLDFRFGFYQYKVNVLQFDFGTSGAADAGIPGLNFDDTFTSGLPSIFVGGNNTSGPGDFEFGAGLEVNRCNCPLDQDEKQWQVVSNLTKLMGNHTVKFGFDIRRAYNLRVPSDAHRSGELTFSENRTIGPNGGGLGLATFLLGDVTLLPALRRAPARTPASGSGATSTTCRTPGAPTSKLTINAGLRADIYNPQTVNEAGNGGWLDINTGEIRVGGVGDIDLAGNVENKINWAPRLGLSYQINEKTVIRAGYGRSYDTGVFGSIFGHAVTQNLPVLSIQKLNAPNNFDSVFNLAQGPSAPVFAQPGPNGRFPLPNGVVRAPAARQAERARPRRLERHRPAPALEHDVGRAGLRGQPQQPRVHRQRPGRELQRPDPRGLPHPEHEPAASLLRGPDPGSAARRPGRLRKLRRGLRLDPGSRLLLQLRKDRLPVPPGQDHAALRQRLVAARPLHLPEGEEQRRQLLLHRPRPQLRARTGSTATTTSWCPRIAELPFGKGKRYASDATGFRKRSSAGGRSTRTSTSRAACPSTWATPARAATGTWGQTVRISSATPTGRRPRTQWFNATPIGEAGSAFGRPARGTFGNMERNSLTGPGFWNVDASLFKRFRVTKSSDLEFRIEVVNLFNHVNLGQPDNTVGTATDPRPNAGRITSTAAQNQMRNLQFGLRFQF